MAAKLLYAAAMRVGTATDQTGFSRHSGAIVGFMPVARIPAGELNSGTTATSRIIRLLLDTSTATDHQLLLRVNRRQDFDGRWLRIGDDWFEIDFDGDSGAGEITPSLDDLPNWSTSAWTAGDYLPVGIYDSDPRAAGVLPHPKPTMLWSATMTVGESGDNNGWRQSPAQGTLVDADGDATRAVTVDDGAQNLNWVYYTDTSGSEALHIEMSGASQAARIGGLWFAFRGSDDGLIATSVTAVSADATLTIDTQPDDPGWATDDVIGVELWDQHPETLITPDGIAVQPGQRYFF